MAQQPKVASETRERGRYEGSLFDLIRIIAAAMVVIGHAWPLSGEPGPPRIMGITIHHLGVYIFFTLSGYLLARSWARGPQPAPFLIRRALRIFPALCVVVLITVSVLGPAMTTLDPGSYWRSGQTWNYLWNLTLLAEYDLPGVFLDNPSRAVNGSLWSLGPEFSCYLMLVIVGLLGPRVSRGARLLLGVGIAAAILAVPLTGPLRTTMIAVVFFIIGSLWAELPGSTRLPLWPLVPGALALFLLDAAPGLVAAWAVVPYAVVAIGTRSVPALSPILRVGDPSYGMYLWAFPIQQLVISAFGPIPIAASIAIVLPISLLLGYASWHLVERRAIGLGRALSARVAAMGRHRV